MGDGMADMEDMEVTIGMMAVTVVMATALINRMNSFFQRKEN
ncbi:hypothetical protein [Paenibacillus ferrarius]|nr:hypothetical protein [Paenibacillus ferrarius]